MNYLHLTKLCDEWNFSTSGVRICVCKDKKGNLYVSVGDTSDGFRGGTLVRVEGASEQRLVANAKDPDISSHDSVAKVIAILGAAPQETFNPDNCHIEQSCYGYGWFDCGDYEIGRGGNVTGFSLNVKDSGFSFGVDSDLSCDDDEENKDGLNRAQALERLEERECELAAELSLLRSLLKRIGAVAPNFMGDGR